MGRTVQTFAVKQALNYLENNPEENIPKLTNLVDKVLPADYFSDARDAIHSLWHTARDSRSMKTCSVPARCWKTRKSCKKAAK